MKYSSRVVAGLTLMSFVFASPISAQDQGSMQIGAATLSIGAGISRLDLPDVKFTRETTASTTSPGSAHVTNNDIDGEYGWGLNGEFIFPTTVLPAGFSAIAISGFYANIEEDDSRTCTRVGAILGCAVSPIIPGAAGLATPGTSTLTTSADREVEHYGIAVEARINLGAQGYFALGGDIRGINQDTDLNMLFSVQPNTPATYEEELDTQYIGIFGAYGRDYSLPFFSSITSGLGLQSSFRVWGGIYHTEVDYNGHYNGGTTGVIQNLSLDNTETSFIGGITLETRKRISARTTLSLKSDYEYYSWVPEMLYNETNAVAAANFRNGTTIDDDDAFSMTTMLTLKIKLGPDAVMEQN